MNPETAKIIDRLVTSSDGLRKLDIADYAMIRDAREAMADAANALTNYAKTFAVIEQNDQAAALHLYPTPGEVGEAEKNLTEWLTRWDAENDLTRDIRTLLSALSEATERAGRMERDATRLKEKLDEAGEVIAALLSVIRDEWGTLDLDEGDVVGDAIRATLKRRATKARIAQLRAALHPSETAQRREGDRG